MIDWLNTIDTQAFLALNGLHAPYFDAFMKLFTGKWIWVPMYAAVLFAVVRNYRVSRNLVGINFRHPNVMPNFAVWKTITYRHWHKWCCQPRF